ncbi:lysis protein [Ewingella americana]|uniref:Lysis protein n=1 Tax=Ewingella americana TaxID=41202 RepID=A0A502GL75_9GAMM|nr:lysis protein [Ewingella americana]TPG62571.1 lysis protein [Ewingella americana]
MVNKTAAVLTVLISALIGALMWAAFHYYGKTISQQKEISVATALADTRLMTINSMAEQQQAVADIDAKYIQELSDAQKNIGDLRVAVDSGTKQLHVNATCNPKRVSKTGTTAIVDDAATARLTDAAQSNYFTLRERIETATKQIAGLQAYILALQKQAKNLEARQR